MHIIRSFKWIISGVALFFILRIFFSSFDQSINFLKQLSVSTISLSIAFFLFYFYLRAFSWDFILKSLGEKKEAKKVLPLWFFAEVFRYIPGNVWSYLSRAYLGEQVGLKKTTTSISLVIEALMMIVVAFILGAPAFSFLSQPLLHFMTRYANWLLGLVFISSIVCFVLRKKIAEKFYKVLQLKNQKFSRIDLLSGLLLQFFSWLAFGLGTALLLIPISQNNFLLGISLSIFSWLIGYLSFITPMGLGVREVVLTGALSQFLSVEQAAVISILSRFLLIITELGNVSVWLYLSRRFKSQAILDFLLRRWDLVILFFLIASYIITFSTLTILRHNAFSSGYDLANMDQTLWNTLHGRFFMMSGENGTVSRLATHTDFILILLAPLYFLWDNVRILLITQSAALGLGAVPLFLLAKRMLGNRLIALILAAIYLLNPNMEWTNMYDFHGVALAIPFILAAFYFGYIRKWRWYWLFFLLALITKEEISLFLAIMGVYFLIFFRQWKVGLLSFLIGAVWFPLMVFIVIPHASTNGQHWAFNNWFSTQKADIDSGDFRMLLKQVREISVSPQAIDYYIALLKPFSFLPLLGFPWFMMARPEILINLLSNNALMLSIQLHYDSGITPAHVIATVFAFYYLQWAYRKLLPSRYYKFGEYGLVGFALMALIVSVRVNYHYAPLPTTPSCWCYIYQVTDDDRQFERIIQSLPKDAAVSASGEVRSHLTHREFAYTLPYIPDNVHYVAMIDQERAIGSFEPHLVELDLIKEFEATKKFTLVNHTGHFYLYKR